MGTQAPHLQALEAQEAQRQVSKEELLQPKIKTSEVFIESLGGKVKLRSLSHAQRQMLRQKAKFQTPEYDDDLFTMLAIIESLVEPKVTEEDLAQLREQDVGVIDELVMQVQLLNMLGKAEELKKG